MEYTTESLSELILQIINNILSKFFNSVDKTVYNLLDELTFIDENFLYQNNIEKIIGENSSNGILLICNALLLGFFIFYGIQYLLSHLTYKQIQKPSQFIFKAIIFIGIMNSSFWMCQEFIYIISLITKAINYLCEDLFNITISFSEFISHLNTILYTENFELDIFSFDGIIKSFSSIGMLSLLFTYSLRYLLIQVFVIICPFAILSLLSESTEYFFRAWIKNFFSLLLIQILLSIILLLGFSLINLSNAEIQKLLYIATIYAINKSNHIIRELIGGISFEIKQALPFIKN